MGNVLVASHVAVFCCKFYGVESCRQLHTKLLIYNELDAGIIKLDWEVAYPDWPELRNKIRALDCRYKEAWITDDQ